MDPSDLDPGGTDLEPGARTRSGLDSTGLEAERIERAALADLHAAAGPAGREALGLELDAVGTALVSIARHEPSILFNRTVGFGVEAPERSPAVAAVVERYRRAGVGRYFIQLHPQARPARLAEWLSEAGLVPARAWTKFVRKGGAPPQAPALRAERIGRDRAADFGRIASAAFGLSPPAARVIAALAGRPGWHLYLSFAGGEPAGTGALFLRQGSAWLDWGATRAELRCRGSQSALLARRIQDALALGCHAIFTATGEAVTGDPQHSYHNILRAGLSPLVRRENLAPSASSHRAAQAEEPRR